MCGFAGSYQFGSVIHRGQAWPSLSIESVSRRGPDEAVLVDLSRCSLAGWRLAINGAPGDGNFPMVTGGTPLRFTTERSTTTPKPHGDPMTVFSFKHCWPKELRTISARSMASSLSPHTTLPTRLFFWAGIDLDEAAVLHVLGGSDFVRIARGRPPRCAAVKPDCVHEAPCTGIRSRSKSPTHPTMGYSRSRPDMCCRVLLIKRGFAHTEHGANRTSLIRNPPILVSEKRPSAPSSLAWNVHIRSLSRCPQGSTAGSSPSSQTNSAFLTRSSQ